MQERSDKQKRQIVSDTETIHKFLDGLDPIKNRDFIYLIDGGNRREELIREVLSHQDHNYGEKAVTAAWLERRYLSPPAYDFMEFYAGGDE